MIDWPAPLPLGMDSDAARDTNGNVIIVTSREFSDGQGHFAYNYNLVADAAGNVLTAMLATSPASFLPQVKLPPMFQPPHWIWNMLENNGFLNGGYIGGTIGELKPTEHGRYKNGAPWYGIGDLGVLQNNTLLAFGTGSVVQNIKGSLPMSFDWMFQGYVFWQGNSGRTNDIGRWDLDGGAVDFINYGFDPNHAAGDFGTDGVDMVWIEGEGASSDNAFYTTAGWWTSPYVTNPSMIQRRRLRSENPNAILGVPTSVGCGFSAYQNGYGIRVVRLSDGWSWFLSNVLGTSGWGWQQALALSCTELFASVVVAGPIYTMARVPLANLGAGTPPD